MDHRLRPDKRAVTLEATHIDSPAEPDTVHRVMRTVSPTVFGKKIRDRKLKYPISLPIQISLRLSSRAYGNIETMRFLPVSSNGYLEKPAIPPL
jgi:hypothetical protein